MENVFSVVGVASVATTATPQIIEAVLVTLERSKSADVCLAMAMAYACHADVDEAARTAVIACGPGSRAIGHYTTYSHGVRSRIRINDPRGTRTCVESSAVARGRDVNAYLSGWRSHVILRQIHEAIGFYVYDAFIVRERAAAQYVAQALRALGHRAWLTYVSTGFGAGCAVVTTADGKTVRVVVDTMPSRLVPGSKKYERASGGAK